MPRRYYDRDFERYGQRGDYGYGRQGRMGSYNRGYGQDYGNRYGNQGYRGGFERDYDENYFGGGYSSDYGSPSYYGQGMGSEYYGESDYGRGRYGMTSGRGLTGGYDREYDDYDTGYTGSRYNRGGYYGRGYNRDYDREYDRGYYGRGREDRSWWDRTSDEVSSWFGDEEAERRRQMDERGYRGKGPKNYTRSDDRIKEDINDELSDSYYLDASDIEVNVSNGEVTLSGNVNSRYAKREAEDIAEDVSGVKHVQNNLRVQSYESSSENQYQTSTSTTTGTSTGKSTTGTSRSKTASS